MSYSPPRRFTDIPVKLPADPEARHAQEELINAYEAEEERIINVLSRKLEKLREDKIDLENALEAESESHVNKLSRQLGSMRMEHEELKAKYEALVVERGHVAEGEEGSSSSTGPSSGNGLERKHQRRKGGFLSGGDKKKKRSAGKSKDTASSNSTSTPNGKLNSKGKEKARSSSRSPPRPQAMSRSSTLTAISTMMGGGFSEPSADMMLTAMKRENEQLRNRLVDTEREYIRLSRLNEIYREELISHRRRLGLSVDNLIGISADPVSQPTHHRSQSSSNQNPYHSNMSSPSTSMYHIPTMNAARHYDTQEHLSMNGHTRPYPSNTKHPSSSSKSHSSNGVQGVPIPRPAGETTRRVRPKNIISSEGSTPLSRSPASDDVDSNIDDEEDEDDDEHLFSPGASGSASGAGSISPFPLFSPVTSSHMHMAQYGYANRHAGGSSSGGMRSASGASASAGGEYYNYGSANGAGYNHYTPGAQPASYASVDTSATSPPSSGGGLGLAGPGAAGGGGGLGGFAGLMGMRGIGVPSLGAMAANASGMGRGRGANNAPMQRGLSYPSVPPPSLSSSLGSVSPSVPLYMHYRDRDRDRDGREWGEGSREPSLSPVEPLSRRNSLGGPGGRRGSVGAGGRVAETGSLRSSRRASFDYSHVGFGGAGPASGSGANSVLGLSGIPIAGSMPGGAVNVGVNMGSAAAGPGMTVHPSGARVAETGSLLRSSGASGRSRAGSLTLSGGGYVAGYGYFLPETVDEGEGGEEFVGMGASVSGRDHDAVGGNEDGGAGGGEKRAEKAGSGSVIGVSGSGPALTLASTSAAASLLPPSSGQVMEDEVVGGIELSPTIAKTEI
ncbi:hypothetical protein BJ165DRAFT_10210 [Panaeolus papilionaceus]|nr:hypothetical protein BJ165DRAFT_10210 [Panaeolus papilionaceus]